MKIVFAIDSFKGSLTSLEAGKAAAEGARRVFPDAECVVRPLADGGEGTVEALVAGLGGELKSGVEIVLEETRFEEFIRDADVVVTGEGRLDSQTVMGKAPVGVARAAKRLGKKVLAFSGCVTSDAGVVNEHGIDAFFPILRKVTTLEEALERGNAAKNLADTAEQVFRCLRLGER